MESTPARILTAAKAIHARDGQEGLSMRRLAARLGMTAPAIYHHFANREAILESLSQEGFDRLIARLEQLSSRRRPTRQCKDFLTAYREFALDEPHLFAAMFLARRRRARQFPEDFSARRSTAFSMLADRVRAAIKARQFRDDDADEVALTLWATAHGLVLLQRAGRFGGTLASYRRAFDRSLDRLFLGLARQ